MKNYNCAYGYSKIHTIVLVDNVWRENKGPYPEDECKSAGAIWSESWLCYKASDTYPVSQVIGDITEMNVGRYIQIKDSIETMEICPVLWEYVQIDSIKVIQWKFQVCTTIYSRDYKRQVKIDFTCNENLPALLFFLNNKLGWINKYIRCGCDFAELDFKYIQDCERIEPTPCDSLAMKVYGLMEHQKVRFQEVLGKPAFEGRRTKTDAFYYDRVYAAIHLIDFDCKSHYKEVSKYLLLYLRTYCVKINARILGISKVKKETIIGNKYDYYFRYTYTSGSSEEKCSLGLAFDFMKTYSEETSCFLAMSKDDFLLEDIQEIKEDELL